MIPPELLKAYVADFGGRMGSAADYAHIPFMMLDRFTKGNWSERPNDHGYSAEERLESAIYRRLQRKRIDGILAKWRGEEMARQEAALVAEGEAIMQARNGNGQEQQPYSGPRVTLIPPDPDLSQPPIEIPLARSSNALLIGRVPEVIADPTKKRCTKCHEWKNRSEFNRGAARKDGLRYDCRVCQHKVYYEKKRMEVAPVAESVIAEPQEVKAVMRVQINDGPAVTGLSASVLAIAADIERLEQERDSYKADALAWRTKYEALQTGLAGLKTLLQ